MPDDDSDICGAECVDGSDCQHPAESCPVPSHSTPGAENPAGRPSEPAVGKDVIDAITARIAEGKSDAEAFRQSNLHPSTKGNWLQKIDDPNAVPRNPDFENDPYGYFFRRYTHAQGLGESFYVENIMDMALENDDVATLMTMLKQRYPDEWGDVDRGDQTGGVVVKIDADDTTRVDPDTLEVMDDG